MRGGAEKRAVALGSTAKAMTCTLILGIGLSFNDHPFDQISIR